MLALWYRIPPAFLAFFLLFSSAALCSSSNSVGRFVDSKSCPQELAQDLILPKLTRTEEGICSAVTAAAGTKEMASGEGWRVLVAGGTGAIGKYLVAELLASDRFVAVTVIGRREITFPPDKQPSSDQLTKLKYKQVSDLAEIATLEPSQLDPSKYDAAFCALGTTRKDAGSAEAFRKIDYEGVVNFGDLAKKTDVRHLQLVTSGMANKNSFFLYTRTKGEAEEHYKSLDVKQLTIFQPPLLDRGDKARTLEKVAKFILPTAKVGDVAKAMVKQAETVLLANASGQETLGWGATKKLIGI